MNGKFGAKGITLGAGKAVSAVSPGEGHGQGSGTKNDRERLLENDRKHRRNVLRKKPPVVT